MNISKFYRKSSCAKLAQLDAMVNSSATRNLIMAKIARTVCYMLCEKKSKEKILERVGEELLEAYKELQKTYPEQEKEWLMLDTGKIERFIDYLESEELIPIACDKLVEQRFGIDMPDGSQNLTCFVSLLVKKEGQPARAIFIHAGEAKRSIKGKKPSTKAADDLNAIVAKLALEKEYPNIEIDVVYLTNEKDTCYCLHNFLVNDTKISNIHRIPYSDYYSKDGVFDDERLVSHAKEVIGAQVARDCDDCREKHLCQTPLFPFKTSTLSIDEQIEAVEKEKERATYNLPNYTDEQKEVVNFGEGTMVVCAGPGSGKTATLSGRIYHLVVEKKIPSEFILVVTFTNKAVQELRDRCLGFLEEENLPNICTFHSFCYSVLRSNKHLFKKGEVKVLGEMDKIKIIKGLMSVFPRIRGLNYDVPEGPFDVPSKILERITYLEENGLEAFMQKYDCGEDFFEFYEQYKLAVKDGGFITFNQMVEYCNALFEKHPEILSMYQSIYQYVMVDEYQDVNEEQVRLLYSLVKLNQNLVVVGDDDQTIYSFRGSDSKYMINFDKDFPNAKKVIFTKNFRSSEAIVEAAKMLISNNQKRITKDIKSYKGEFGRKELPPVIVPSMDFEVVDGLIEALLEEGYKYSDIAILSSKNKHLKAFHASLKAPTFLSKTYIGEDAFFILFFSSARLYLNPMDDAAAFQFFRLYDSEFFVAKEKDGLLSAVLKMCGIEMIEDVANGELDYSCPYAKAVSDLFNYFSIYAQQEKLETTLDLLLLLSGWDESNIGDELKELIANNQLESLNDLVQLFTDLLNYDPEGVRVEFKNEDKVTLITSHESKGKEYKVVIYRNDCVTEEDMEEVRRVAYVTITRPMERVYILQGHDTKFDISNEINHILLEGVG